MKSPLIFAMSLVAITSLAACDRTDEPSPAETEPVFGQRGQPMDQPVLESEPAVEEREPVAGSELDTDELSMDEPTAAPIHSRAIDAITEARCQREQRCGNVGPDEEYESEQACMSEIRDEWRDDLSARECPGGIVQKELNECLEEIRNNDCGDPFDTLGRVAACRSSDICKGTE